MKKHLVILAVLALTCLPAVGQAHPVPRRSHDRTIVVRLALDERGESGTVIVDYQLEVDEFTVVFDDLPALSDQVDLTRLRKPQEFYEAYTRVYAPILAANLVARVDGKPLDFECRKHGHRLRDEEDRPLDHLRCNFHFQAAWRPAPRYPAFLALGRPGSAGELAVAAGLLAGSRPWPHQFHFREGNYELEPGRVQLSLRTGPPLQVLHHVEPDAALKARPIAELRPGDDTRLRTASATFIVPLPETLVPPPTPDPEPPAKPAETPAPSQSISLPSLTQLMLSSEYGFWALLCISAGVGAIHALTPGHGKTLVAAYLVGERGTIWHALVLGLVTTLTHTGIVLVLAVVLRLCFPQGKMSASTQQDLQMILGLGGGLLVAGMGFWLLLRRLSGQADHIHIGGHGHHHHHGHDHRHEHGHDHADHYHDEHGHVIPTGTSGATGGKVGWWSLVVLGVSGGIVPCWDAVAMLVLAVAMNLLWLALPLLLAFSAGLAAVLVALGIVVVQSKKRLAGVHWQAGANVIHALPLVSAIIVTLLGLWLCYDSVHTRTVVSG